MGRCCCSLVLTRLHLALSKGGVFVTLGWPILRGVFPKPGVIVGECMVRDARITFKSNCIPCLYCVSLNEPEPLRRIGLVRGRCEVQTVAARTQIGELRLCFALTVNAARQYASRFRNNLHFDVDKVLIGDPAILRSGLRLLLNLIEMKEVEVGMRCAASLCQFVDVHRRSFRETLVARNQCVEWASDVGSEAKVRIDLYERFRIMRLFGLIIRKKGHKMRTSGVLRPP
eukprot:TRINITY_DN21197_c0_g1_i1.p1 TRINITY_DN21197_c0_g1~~TRINITY_DN21197_c0_g1_i1.p1  ORF type:complete len:229 (-),score=7.28 TRINITY_DN21197_c0_g1_i1:260-946(-)